MLAKEVIGKNITRSRVIGKISRKSLAEFLGISESLLRSYELGEKYADSYTVIKIANLLNIPPAFFYYPTDDSEVIKFNKSIIPKKDLESIKELFRYKVSGIPTLVYCLKLPVFSSSTLKNSEKVHGAMEIGISFANDFLERNVPLSSYLEEIGIYVIPLNIENPLFRGMFILKADIPIIVIYSGERRENTFLKDLSHEIGRTFYSSDDVDEETFCDHFSLGFCERLNDSRYKLGTFDFLKRKTVEAWENEEISGSRAAEILCVRTGDFILENG